MEMINKERVLQEFLELIRIPCPTRNERAVGDWLTGRLTALGACPLCGGELSAASFFSGGHGHGRPDAEQAS